MNDPYVYPNGTLKNSAGITNYDELCQYESNVAAINLIDINNEFEGKFDANLFKKLHRHIFSDVYDWAGEYRKVDLYKEEAVIGGASLNYAEHNNISNELNDRINDLNNTNWSNKSQDQICNDFARKIALLWKVHPFRDGNTRTTLAFASLFSEEHDFPIDFGKIFAYEQKKFGETTDPRARIRDCFVLASLEEQNQPEPEHLAYVFKSAIVEKEMKKNEDEEMTR